MESFLFFVLAWALICAKTNRRRRSSRRAPAGTATWCRSLLAGRCSQSGCSVPSCELEQVHEVADGGAVQRDIGIAAADTGVGEVVAAAVSQWRQPPVGLDELQDGDVVSVDVRDVARARPWRDDDGWNARAVPEEIQRLNVPGVVVTAAF